MRSYLGTSVFEQAIDRMVKVYEAGHRVVLSFSGGKDSGCTLEICVIAARLTNRLPVEVVMRDEEIMLPGTFEYAERVADRIDEIDFHWVVANQPVINIFNRSAPYFWVFDPQIDPDEWVRQPPARTEYIKEQDILALINAEKFPPPAGKELIEVVGLRVQESAVRRAGLASSGGYLTKVGANGARKCRPIYDWTDGDVWKAIGDQHWDYNAAYDTMYRMGMKRSSLRIGPPTMTWYSLPAMQIGAKAWPRWFDRVCARLPGVRTAVMFGKRAVQPERRMGETWHDTYKRTCIDDAPAEWIRERSIVVRDYYLHRHGQHATTPFPDIRPCSICSRSNASWRNLSFTMYNGNPFALKMYPMLPYVEPEFFRAGAGKWGGKPTW
jgi:predicted phosphoadenosine phosphosulfate sulfurtransferase